MLYDGLCPICVKEIRFLQFLQRKKPGKVDFIDISLPGYDGTRHSNISYEMAMEEMHVIDEKEQVRLRSSAFPGIFTTSGWYWKICWDHFYQWSPSVFQQVHRGVPAFAVMYSAVGLGWLGRLMMCGPARPLMDKAYGVFARNRLKWTGRGEECSRGRCEKATRKE